jgi:hypothetical protein
LKYFNVTQPRSILAQSAFKFNARSVTHWFRGITETRCDSSDGSIRTFAPEVPVRQAKTFLGVGVIVGVRIGVGLGIGVLVGGIGVGVKVWVGVGVSVNRLAFALMVSKTI